MHKFVIQFLQNMKKKKKLQIKQLRNLFSSLVDATRIVGKVINEEQTTENKKKELKRLFQEVNYRAESHKKDFGSCAHSKMHVCFVRFVKFERNRPNRQRHRRFCS